MLRQKKNKKIRNATKSEFNGIVFDSKLELFMYQQLQSYNIDFEFKPKYILQEKFRYRGEAIREITYTPDFRIRSTGLLIDCKGYANETFPLKKKMLYKILHAAKTEFRFEMPKNKVECRDLVLKIKTGVI